MEGGELLNGDEIENDGDGSGAEDNEGNENMLIDLISEDIPMEILPKQEVRKPNIVSFAGTVCPLTP